jgi:hypothetical protein
LSASGRSCGASLAVSKGQQNKYRQIGARRINLNWRCAKVTIPSYARPLSYLS